MSPSLSGTEDAMKFPPAVGHIVARSGQLKQLTDRAAHFGLLNGHLRAAVGEPLAAHVRLAAVRDGCVVVQADSAAWASRLRFRAPAVLAALGGKPGFEGVRSLRVRTRTDARPEPPEAPRRARMSDAAAEALSANAASVPDDAVRDALLRLARNASR